MNSSALSLLIIALFSLAGVQAQIPARPAVPGPLPPAGLNPPPVQTAASGSGGNLISFTATPVAEVLAEYFRVTGRKVLRDRGLENAVVTIDVPGEFSDEEYRAIIEKGLLMHGYALVPSGGNLFKLIATEGGSLPSAQNVPMILRAEDLPDSDQVVTHVLQLSHLGAEEASAAFQTIIPLHPYGRILAVPNSQSLVITEASQTIRAYLELSRQVDQPPVETVQRSIRIERAEAQEVVEQLEVLLGLDKYSAGRSAEGARAGGASDPGAASTAATAVPVSGMAQHTARPLMQAVARTNTIVVVARPLDLQKIEALVRELDAEASASRYFSRKLNYLDLSVFLSIAEKALMRNDPRQQDNSLESQQKSQPSAPAQPANIPQSFGAGAAMGTGGGTNVGAGIQGGGGLSGGGAAGQGFGAGSIATDLQITRKPISILIANTLVIADPASSKFFASGPPDQIKALQDLAEELDVRPRQILLSAIIGEFTLSDNFNFGLDWIQTLKQVGDDGLVGGVLNTQGTAFADPSNLKNMAGFLAAGGPATLGGLTAYGQINKNLNVFLQTLESTKRFHVLQKPTLTTLNHQPARIYIGQQVAIAGQSYTSGVVGGGFTSTTQYIPVRLQLDITPHIFNDAEVMLEFKQQNNDISNYTTISGNQVPNISEQGMANSLIVADRATAMLGGLITERDTNNKSGLPFLVRIPIVKNLFGSTRKAKERREMMIFVQPRILPDSASHYLEQARFGDYSASFDEAAQFAGMPETMVPRAIPAADGKPNALLPAPDAVESEPKKGLLGKMKGWFQKTKTE